MFIIIIIIDDQIIMNNSALENPTDKLWVIQHCRTRVITPLVIFIIEAVRDKNKLK
jgi:hypothetical protein